MKTLLIPGLTAALLALAGCSATPSTIVEPSALRDHLAIVKAQGWAVDDAEVFETLKCVAAPLRRPDGTVVAAVSISSPAGLADDAYEHALVTLLEALTTIEAKLTHWSAT